MWAYTDANPGAFLICTAMYGSGQRTGTQHTVREHRPILRVRRRAPAVSSGRLLVRYGHEPAFGLPRPQQPQLPQLLHRLPCRFPAVAADVASPEMSILGDANITQLQDTAWVDPGVEAHDVRDGNLTSSVSVSGTVDVNTTGTYHS